MKKKKSKSPANAAAGQAARNAPESPTPVAPTTSSVPASQVIASVQPTAAPPPSTPTEIYRSALRKPRTLLPKTWFTVAVFCLLSAGPYFWPPLERFRIMNFGRISAPLAAWSPGALDRIFIKPRPVVIAVAPPKLAATLAPTANITATPPGPPSLLTGDYAGKGWPVESDLEQILKEPADNISIHDASCSMNHFYSALERTEQKLPGAITRIEHFGDSPISGDLISGAARTLLQDKFGDSGHGWILASKPWDFYYHEGVRMDGKGWLVSAPVLPGGSGDYGLGGASFTASSPDAVSEIRTAPNGEGSSVGRFDIYFRAQPHGGSFLATVDEQGAQEYSTAADQKTSAVVSIPVKDGPHTLRITPRGNGPVTLYGVVLERNQPGVVYDTMGMLGATVHHLTFFHADDWIQDLQDRKPDLIILNYGTNESNYGYLPFNEYVHNYDVVIKRIRAALPATSILIMSPMDRGTRDDDGDIVTIPGIPILVAAQQRLARSEGVAFFDTFAAMGGVGTMARWYEESPRLVTGDFTHPTGLGAEQLGTALVSALLKGYAEYKRDPGAPCAAPPAEVAATDQKAQPAK